MDVEKGISRKNSRPAKKICSVYECHNKISKDISLHNLPNDHRRQEWIDALKMGKVPKNTFVCSEHFEKSDYILPDVPTKRRSLKKTAIPSKKLPMTNVEKYIEKNSIKRKQAADDRRKRYALREAKTFVGAEVEAVEVEVGMMDQTVNEVDENLNAVFRADSPEVSHDVGLQLKTVEKEEDLDVVKATNASGIVETDHDYDVGPASNPYRISRGFAEADHSYGLESKTKDFCAQFSPALVTRDIGIQVTGAMIDEKPFRITDHIDGDNQLNIMTGIPSFALLHAIEKNVKLAKEKLKLDTKNHALTVLQIIVLIFTRFKLNVSFEFISVLFSVSSKTFRLYYDEMLPVLSFVFKSAIVWPSKEDVLKTMPRCFLKYRNTRVVIDCTEIPVEKPKCLNCAIKIYSFYKSGETVKFLLGVTPSGLVSLISSPYGGRASDKAITDQSSLYSVCDPFDDIMADKGFLIEQECENHFLRLVRPHFLKNKAQFTLTESEQNRGIAAARVHVERAIQRLKIFKIFKTKYVFRRIHQIEDVMIIIGGLVNLSNPILSDDKFSVQ